MAWARFDDAFYRNPKVVALLRHPKGSDALALYPLLVTFCCERLTDGLVEKADIKSVVPWHHSRVHTGVNSLVQVGLLSEVEPGEKWQVHDFLDYNYSREQVLLRRQNELARQRRHRHVSRRDDATLSRRDLIGPVPVPILRDKSLSRDTQG